MQNFGFHKSKLYSLILAAVGLISLLLPWISASYGGFASYTHNGFGGWGILVLLGIGGVAAACFMGNKAGPFDEMGKKIVMGGFGAMVLGSALFLLRILTSGHGILKPGFGLFIGLAVSVIGLLLVLGKISVPKSIDDKIK